MAKRTSPSGSAAASKAGGSAGPIHAGIRLALFHGDEAYLQTAYTEQLRASLQQAFGEIELVRFDGKSTSVAQVLDECRSFGLMTTHKLVIVDDGKEWLAEGDSDNAIPGARDDADPDFGDEDEDAMHADADDAAEASSPAEEDTATMALFGSPADPPASPAPAKAPAAKAAASKTAASSGHRRTLRKRELVERYAASPPENATLVIRGKGITPGRLTKAFEAQGVVLKCDPPSAASASTMVRQWMRDRHGRSLSIEAAEALVERVGVNLGRLMHEIDKLALAVDADRPITVDDVAAMVGLTREQQNWEVKKALLAGDYQRTLELIHELMAVSRTPTQLIRWNFLDLAKTLFALGESVAGKGASVNARSLRLWGEEERRAMAIVRRAPLARLRGLLDAAVDADHRAKTGQGNEIRALELLALEFAQLSR